MIDMTTTLKCNLIGRLYKAAAITLSNYNFHCYIAAKLNRNLFFYE